MDQRLKTGDFIRIYLHQEREGKIRARRLPLSEFGYRVRSPDHKEVVSLWYPDPIPNGATALYMGCHVDSLHEAMKRKTGLNFRPGSIVYHLVFWNGMAVWVSSEDVVLQQVK